MQENQSIRDDTSFRKLTTKLTKVQKQGYETTQMQFTAPFSCIFCPQNTKKALQNARLMELITRFELVTSSLPRMRSTNWAISASVCRRVNRTDNIDIIAHFFGKCKRENEIFFGKFAKNIVCGKISRFQHGKSAFSEEKMRSSLDKVSVCAYHYIC